MRRTTVNKTPDGTRVSLSKANNLLSLPPRESFVTSIHHLHQQIGNEAVIQLFLSGKIQAALKLGPPNDVYEQEADQVAEQVTQMASPSLSRTCVSCEREQELSIRKKAEPAVYDFSSQNSFISSLGEGRPLDKATSDYFEPRFGADFGKVRIHTGPSASTSADSINALAFTAGHHIVFGDGHFKPSSVEGRRLLAHELTHVVQQNSKGNGIPTVQRQTTSPAPKPGGAMWVEFDENGGWDAVDILKKMSQNEHTNTVTPAHLPGAGLESDKKRCGSNAALASAIVAGPAKVMKLCDDLRTRIEDYKKRGGMNIPEMPSAEVCDQASANVSRIKVAVYMGTKGGAHAGGGGTLQYSDFDMLAHWLYVFTYNPSDTGRKAGRLGMGDFRENGSNDGRRWRSADEIADAAKIAGYGSNKDWHAFGNWDLLSKAVDSLSEGQSLLVLISIYPHEPNASYGHTITFFKKGDVAFVHDPWEAGQVYPSTDPKYKQSVKGAYDQIGGLKPRGLFRKEPEKHLLLAHER